MTAWQMNRRRVLAASMLAGTAITGAWASLARAQTGSEPPPLPARPDPMAKLDPDMARLIATLKILGPKPIETLEPGEARRQPQLVDAAAKLIKAEKLDPKPHAGLTITDSRYADMGNLHLRFYEPEREMKDSKLPMIFYFRGGGWVIADLDDYDATAAALARKSGAVVISVDYPLAPTERFPAQHDEAIAAYEYVLRNAESWNYDSNRIALVGEGAGGNLALNTAITARERNLARPVAVVSIYPVTTTALDTPSKREDATAKPLSTAAITWFFGYVLRNEQDRQDPRLNLVAADLRGLPPVTIVNAAVDPLRSDGDLIAEKLREADIETTHRVYEGVTHGFFGMDALVAKARDAQDFAVAQIKRGFVRR